MKQFVTCGERLVELLAAYGVDTVFGIPGNHTVPLYRGLAGGPIRHISPRHEQGAGFMADGYARATGRPGVCFLISGPGLTNALTPMMQAMADSVPMLVISAVAARHQLGMGEGHLHELPDQAALAGQCTRFSHTLMRPDELPRVLARAFNLFAAERPGPVHIEIPLDVIEADASHVPAEPWPIAAAPAPAPEGIASAAKLLDGARRPCIIAGGGAVDAAEAITALAQRLDAPVVNTVNAKGLVPAGHPLAVGASPSLASVRGLLADSDVILAIGTEFGETDYDMLFLGELALSAQLVRVDIEAAQLARNQRPALALCGDARLALEALAEVVSPRVPGEGAERTARVRQEIIGEAHYHWQFQALFDTLRQAFPDLLLVGDSTLPSYYAVWQYETGQPRRYFHSATGGGTLGYAIPAALGARLGRPELPVAALIGDGSAQFTIAELAAGVQAQLPIAVLVWNNNGYREIEQGMRAAGIEPVGVAIPAPDFCAIAQAMGCASARPADLDALRRELEASQQRRVPTLIELEQSDFISEPAGQWYGPGKE